MYCMEVRKKIFYCCIIILFMLTISVLQCASPGCIESYMDDLQKINSAFDQGECTLTSRYRINFIVKIHSGLSINIVIKNKYLQIYNNNDYEIMRIIFIYLFRNFSFANLQQQKKYRDCKQATL